ncbi:putative xanthine dehydrogenase FAD-binding subunit XdhB [Desulfovibrionales bacterium]
MYAIKRYQKASNVAEAIRLLAANPTARPIAGGTDLLIQLRAGHADAGNLVDLHDLPELRGIRLNDEGVLVISAGTTFTDLLESPLVAAYAPVLAEAAATIAGPQIRNIATIGGNICNGAVSADSVPPLLVLDAILEVAGPNAVRTTSLQGFHTGPGHVALQQAELLIAIRLPVHALTTVKPFLDTKGGVGTAFFKYAAREAQDIATVSCAATVRLAPDAKITYLALAFGVAAPTPIRCPTAEATAVGRSVAPADLPLTLDAIRAAVSADVTPRTSWRASKEFRLHIITELTGRVITKAATKALGQARVFMSDHQGGNPI